MQFSFLMDRRCSVTQFHTKRSHEQRNLGATLMPTAIMHLISMTISRWNQLKYQLLPELILMTPGYSRVILLRLPRIFLSARPDMVCDNGLQIEMASGCGRDEDRSP
jgi:hypothetical protein